MHTPTDILRQQFKNVWVVAELRHGAVQDVTYELLGAGRRLAASRGCQVWCVVLGHNIKPVAQALIHRGADVVLMVDHQELESFVDEVHARQLQKLIDMHKPEIVLCGATARGRALIPRVAVLVRAGLTADCTGLEIEQGSGLLLQTRPAFGGNILATIKCTDFRPQMATVRPRVMSALQADPSRAGRIIDESFSPDIAGRRMKVLRIIVDTQQTINLADATFIVAGGRGMGGKEGFELLSQFARMVGGAVGASRAAVDAGWIGYSHQVGQTGQTVQPKVYFACGISGQIQHLVGMQSSDLIIAINKDPNTPMMQLADYAVVGDAFEILGDIMEEIRKT